MARVARDVPVTERQLDVLRLVARGQSNKQIARRLGISLRTVEKHLENIYDRLGASCRLAAVMRAQRLGVLPPRSIRRNT